MLNKKKMFKYLIIVFVIILGSFYSCITFVKSPDAKYKYKSFTNDPLNARIYTLGNGLKVFMTVYKDEPRVQTFVAVKTGSKKDPEDCTGLAHYLEHLLFKGTDDYGTVNWEKEKVEIDKIINLYESHRQTADTLLRKNIYHQIDSISNVAAQYAATAEFNQMMNSFGATGTNAYTSVEQTVYMNNIPSNQLDKWLIVEAERFKDPVLRFFHTELEVVYEEKNISLDNDARKVDKALGEGLFKKHPYGTHTVLGRVEHLKNPSMKEVYEYFHTYYVPNNMAICLSGDFDPDQLIKSIDNTFGKLKPKKVPKYQPPQEKPITAPIVKSVWGPDAESTTLAFRFPGVNFPDADLLKITNGILFNRYSGLIDLNLNQKQKVIDAYAYVDDMQDYSVHQFGAKPREGQSLEDVAQLILAQIEKIKVGDFPDWMPAAIINKNKVNEIQRNESNWVRAHSFVNSFVKELPYQKHIQRFDRQSQFTKQDIVEFANKYYLDNYVVVYKRTGESPKIDKITKPQITPPEIVRTNQSDFAKNLIEMKAEDIKPVFIDYEKDIDQFKIKSGIPIYYKENIENDLFRIYYLFDMGTDHNKKLGPALDYLEFLGTSEFTPDQIQQEFYKLGCSFWVNNSNDQAWVGLSGLRENMESGIKLFEKLLSDPQPNEIALENQIQDILKVRSDDKLSKNRILWGAMRNYGVYGAFSPFTNILTESEVRSMQSSELIEIIKKLNSFEHRILYYGPDDEKTVSDVLNSCHSAPSNLKPIPEPVSYTQQETSQNTIHIIDYDMKQVEIMLLSKGKPFDLNLIPIKRVFNEYYGSGGMSVVFQELRESKALAYRTFASYTTPEKKEDAHYIISYIGTQADKLQEAINGMFDVLNDMRVSENSFNTAKSSVINEIKTERITKQALFFNYEDAQDLGINHDLRKTIYDNVPNFEMSHMQEFFDNHIKNRKYNILVLGDIELIDIDEFAKFGSIEYLTLEDVFGY